MFEDLQWFGFVWQEGPDIGGKFGPYSQSERTAQYRAALERLQALGLVYPCRCSRQDVLRALQAPHLGEDEPIYPGTCRPKEPIKIDLSTAGPPVNWRFLVQEGEPVSFVDRKSGPQTFVAGKDFGDFVVWRHDNVPAYQLAVVVDDARMQITEVVRGEDLLRSTARQLLLYRALGWEPPGFYHCPLVTDEKGVRLAKRHDALSLRALRSQGTLPPQLREHWEPKPEN
jgi:glutamyl-tRNA synthetase